MNSMVTMVIAFLAALAGYGPSEPLQQAPAAAATSSPQRALLDQYCVTCHNEKLKTGGVMFDKMDVQHVASDAETWEKAVEQLRAHAMPPVGRPRPDKAVYDGFRIWLENELDKAGAANLNPGAPSSYHRLNRIEYQNAIKDVLGMDIDASAFLPEDQIMNGFDNMAGSIKMSPDLLETYMKAAMKISRAALGVAVTPQMTTYQLEDDVNQDDRDPDLPFGSRGGLDAKHYFPVDGEYSVSVRLVRLGSSAIAGLNDEHQFDLRVDGERVGVVTIGKKGMRTANGGTGGDGGTVDPDVGGAKANFQFRVPIKAGEHTISATFNKKPELEVAGTAFVQDRPAYVAGRTHGVPYISSITVLGPQKVTAAGNSPSRTRILTCHPATTAEEPACAKRIISTVIRRAYRGQVQDADIQEVMSFYTQGRSKGTFEDGIRSAVERILVSPQFLYRVEFPLASAAAGTNYKLSDLDLASRLSFFLWSTVPDDQLLDLASKGQLKNPAIIDQQVKRMMADPRAESLTANFADQWLQLRDMANANPDPVLFPDADKTLRDSLRRETEMLFDTIRTENRSILDLLTADYTFVNEPVAKLYGIPNIYGPRMRRVTLNPETHRGGILTQGSILMLTSHSDRTSVVVRGKWVLDNLLGTPPPPPPPNVPDLKPSNADGEPLTLRAQMSQHRSNPACAGCHARMDPIGFALENFDATGKWRMRDTNGSAVDTTGELVDGTKFDGPAGLRKVLLANPDYFAQAATEKLLTYALGRGLEYYDMPTVRKIVKDSAASKYSFSSLVIGVIKSAPFQMKRITNSAS